jgi:hypothetical protein
MNPHRMFIPAIASLVLFAANPASALTPVWNPSQGAGVEESTGNIVPAKLSHWAYQCRKYFSEDNLQKCYQMHGLNSDGQRVKSGL